MKLTGLTTVEEAHGESIWAAKWVPKDTTQGPSMLVTGSLDESIKVWNVENDEISELYSSSGYSLGVLSLAPHPNGRVVASTSLDSFVRVFDVTSNTTIATLDSQPSESWHLQFSPNGNYLAVAGGSSATVKLWSTKDWKLSASLEIPREDAISKKPDKSGGRFALGVAWSPDGRYLACSTADGRIAIFDVNSRKFLYVLEGHLLPVRALAFSPVDPHILYSGSDDKNIHIYDVYHKTVIGAMSGHASWVLSLDVNPDGSSVVTGSSDKTVKLWDLSMRAAVQTMSNHSDQVWEVAFRPTASSHQRSNRLVSVSDDKSISLYDFN